MSCLFVFFSGIDGSGKTTLARAVARELREKGIDTEYIWYRWTAFFSYPLLGLCRILGYTEKRKGVVVRRYYLNKAIAFLWSIIYPLDYLLCTFFKLQFMKSKNTVIVIDRFIPDIIADVSVQSKTDIKSTFVGRILLSHLKKEEFIGIVMDINPQTAIDRKDDVPFPSYVRNRRPIYRELAESMNWKKIDGRKDLEENIRKVMRYLENAK